MCDNMDETTFNRDHATNVKYFTRKESRHVTNLNGPKKKGGDERKSRKYRPELGGPLQRARG